MNDYSELKRLAEAAKKQYEDWKAAGEPFPTWNTRLMEMYAAVNPAAVLALIEENERLREERDSQQRVCIRAMEERDQLKAEVEKMREQAREAQSELHCLSMENESLRLSKLYWVSEPGSGLIRCVTDDRYRKFAPSIRAHYEPVRVVQDSASKEDR